MFRNLKNKTKQIQLEKKVKIKKKISCPNFVFALYNLIYLNLQIIFKKKITYLDRSQRVKSIL